MADPSFPGPPGGTPVPPWALPPSLAPPRPLQFHSHQQYPMPPPLPFPTFPPGPSGNQGSLHGFQPQQNQHYYNVGPRPFPSHGISPNQGSFGSAPPPFPPPPRTPPPHTVSGMVSSVQSSSEGAGHFMIGNVANALLYSRTTIGIARSDHEIGFSKLDEGISLIEEAILQSQKENKVDIKGVLSQIRALVDQAEDAVKKVGKLIMLEPSISEPRLVTCPYNHTHRVSPEALFKHFLCCPSNPKPKVDTENLISSLRYPRLQNRDEDSEPEIDDHRSLELKNLSLSDGRNSISLVLDVENMTKGGNKVEQDCMIDRSSALRSPTGVVLKESLSDEVDIWGGLFFYKDAPAVVQAHLSTLYPASEVSDTQLAVTHTIDKVSAEFDVSAAESLPLTGGIGSFLKEELCGDDPGPLLSSRFWFLQREIEMWKELPARCSTLVLHVATGVCRIRRKVVSDWVLMQGPAHGLVIDAAMAIHIHSLAKICLKALQKEAFTVIDHQRNVVRHKGSLPTSEEHSSLCSKSDHATRCGTEDEKLQGDDTSELMKVKEGPISVIEDKGCRLKVSPLDCPHLFQSGHWLASELTPLFGPLQSKVFVLKLLKHLLLWSGRILASSFIDAFTKQASEHRPQLDRPISSEVRDVKPIDELQTRDGVKQIDGKPLKSKVKTVDKSHLPLEAEAAIAAVRERAILESYLRNLNYPSLSAKLQMIQQHEATVTMAVAERRKRQDYRPVLEHDGLIWHRSQLEEKNKNKTREEILAEERDYKRRRMSYRGKKLKRNPTEVLHDLIGGHMEEIVEAGGIGCFVKHTGVSVSAEAGRVDDSWRSSLLSTNDPVNLNQPADAFPPASTSYPMNFDGKDDKGMWHDQPSDRPNWHGDRSNELNRSTTFKQDFRDGGPSSRSNRYSEVDDGGTRDKYKDEDKYRSDGSQGKFHRDNSYYSSDSGKDNEIFHFRPGRDDVNESKGHWVNSSVGHSGKDHRRDRSRGQR